MKYVIVWDAGFGGCKEATAFVDEETLVDMLKEDYEFELEIPAHIQIYKLLPVEHTVERGGWNITLHDEWEVEDVK
jgi:hypothetical protein